LSHDLWVNVVRHGAASEREQLRVARGSTVLLGVLAIVLGVVFKRQNVAYMVGLAFAIAASANFPALVLSMFWRRFTTRAAQMSMIVGTASSLLLIYLSPTIQIDVLSNNSAWFPLRNPGLVTIPLSFVVAIVTAWLWPEPEAEARFVEVEHRVHAVPISAARR
jgi:cation/acetate symporter